MFKPLCVIQAPYATRSGYGDMARDIIRHIVELNRYDIKLISTPWGATPLNALSEDNPKDIVLIDKTMMPPYQLSKKPDLFIQITVPNEFQALGKYNIGITAGIETTLCSLPWIEGCNRMDHIIVISEHSKRVFETTEATVHNPDGSVNSIVKVNKPITVLHNCVDTSIFKKIDQMNIEPSIDDLLIDVKEKFNFLFVGHWLSGGLREDRKNVALLVKLFCDTFKNISSDKRPGLILKTSGANFSILDRERIIRAINEIRNASGLNPPNVYLLHGQITESEMNSLYNHPKVKVNVSFTKGEGFCVLPGTIIPTLNGLKNIEDVSLEDKVYTHQGRWKSVTQLLNREYTGKMIQLDVFGGVRYPDPITFTPNHQILVYRNGFRQWIPAEDVKNTDKLCLPVPSYDSIDTIDIADYVNDENIIFTDDSCDYKHSDKTNRIHPIKRYVKLDAAFGRILGYYLSEGCISNGGILFSLNLNEKDTIANQIAEDFKSVFNVNVSSIKPAYHGRALQVNVHCKIVALLLKSLCGTIATKKTLNSSIYKFPSECIDSLISAIILGDGHIQNKDNFQKTVSLQLVNDNLIREIRWLLLSKKIITSYDRRNSKKFSAQVSRIRVNNNSMFNKLVPIINENSDWKVNNLVDISKVYKGKVRTNIDDEWIYVDIKHISVTQYSGKVYNLSVEDDESYCTENFVVHNCRPLLEASVIGKPIIASGWSGQLDFLTPEDAILIGGELKNVEPGAVWKDVIMPEAQWFNIDENMAVNAMMYTFKNYDQVLVRGEKLAEKNISNFKYSVIAQKTKELLDSLNIPFETPIVLPPGLSLPSLPKLERIA